MNILERASLARLFDALLRKGYTVVGPTVADGTIVYDELSSPDDLPIGWTDVQEGGTYRLERTASRAYFGFNLGPHSWKKYLFPPEQRMWSASRVGARSAAGFDVAPEPQASVKYAFIGVRACELNAIAIQDRVFLHSEFEDEVYRTLRENAFVVAVNCTRASSTCFCVSMDAGPKAGGGFDLALTEVIGEDGHYFTVEEGSEKGADLLREVPTGAADESHRRAAADAVAKAESQMGRTMNTDGIKELLYANYEHPRWENIANRCLSCGNCTLVCPTCFCSTVEDTIDLTGNNAERHRKWDSCFTSDFSYIHGGSIRKSVASKYRQWMTHKLATWQDQFGSLGCVGCGRCITWCPVGIDITEEVLVIRGER
jgi:ferredoxin